MLPHTKVWQEWKMEVLKDNGRDVKEIYDDIANGHHRQNGINPPPNAVHAAAEQMRYFYFLIDQLAPPWKFVTAGKRRRRVKAKGTKLYSSLRFEEEEEEV
jgi:hypothetical protein